MKKILMFENFKDCLFNDKIILESQQGFRSDYHDLYTEEINKIALSIAHFMAKSYYSHNKGLNVYTE